MPKRKRQFRYISNDYKSKWKDCKNFNIDELEAMSQDITLLYHKDWQMEFREVKK